MQKTLLVVCASAVTASAQCDWAPLGSGASPAVNAAALAQNGDLVVGGVMTVAGGTIVGHIARWNGSAWQPLGAGVDDFVRALATLPNGDIVAGGWFMNAGGQPAELVARWDGGSWHRMGPFFGGLDNGTVDALMVHSDGRVIAGGTFLTAGGAPASRVAAWDGSDWTALGALYMGFQPSTVVAVRALVEMPNGDIVAGGHFLRADSGTVVNRVARWDGFMWNPLGGGVGEGVSAVNALGVLPNGDLVIGGTFGTAGGLPAAGAARWDGFAWHALGSGLAGGTSGTGSAFSLVVDGSSVIFGGPFGTAGGVNAPGVARWDSITGAWTGLGSGMQLSPSLNVSGLVVDATGTIFAAGQFDFAGGLPAKNVAQLRFDTVLPTITSQPVDALTCPGGNAEFTVVTSGTTPVAYQWQRQPAPGFWLDIEDGPLSSWIGEVSGTKTDHLIIKGLKPGIKLPLRLRISSTCGILATNTVTLAECYANCDCSNGSAPLDFFDFLCFQNEFNVGSAYADCDGSGTLDFFDFLCFQNEFSAGCP